MADNLWLGLQLSTTAAARPTTPTVEQGMFVSHLASDTGILSVWNPTTSAWIIEQLCLAPTTVAGLPAAAAGNKGARTFITDAAATPVFGAVVTGAGALFVPVFSDGVAWRNG